ncbi:hypothetical protein [Bremerella cremea]|uniref:hypothetical protein n=1 Tax=Bremerella cremea TaxID=1031537 RepID=UPI0031EF5D81
MARDRIKSMRISLSGMMVAILVFCAGLGVTAWLRKDAHERLVDGKFADVVEIYPRCFVLSRELRQDDEVIVVELHIPEGDSCSIDWLSTGPDLELAIVGKGNVFALNPGTHKIKFVMPKDKLAKVQVTLDDEKKVVCELPFEVPPNGYWGVNDLSRLGGEKSYVKRDFGQPITILDVYLYDSDQLDNHLGTFQVKVSRGM